MLSDSSSQGRDDATRGNRHSRHPPNRGLEGRDAKRVFELYRRLSGASVLLPPALAFILDPECRSEQAKKELEHLSGALAVFLPRRMYENYLLHPRAIAAVANGIENFRESGTPVTKEEVSALLDLERAKPENYCAKAVASDWEANIHGADVLKRIFANLSGAQTQFDKVRHSVALTNWIIDNDSEKLLDLAKYVGRILAMSSKKALEAAE